MFERFTDRARKVMQMANQEAQRLNHEFIGTEHLLLGLLKDESGVAGNVLRMLNLDLTRCRIECLKLVQPGAEMVVAGKLPLTPRAKGCIEKAILAARDLDHNHVGTEHLLLGLCADQEGIAAQVLKNFDVTMESVKAEVFRLLGVKSETQEGDAATIAHGQLLRGLVAEWLNNWVGKRHAPLPGCYTCECWEAFDTIFRHVE